MTSDLLLVLELLVFLLDATRHIVLLLLLLLNSVKADTRDLNREFFQCSFILSPFAILLEDFIAELSDWDALDETFFFTVCSRICLGLNAIKHVFCRVLRRMRSAASPTYVDAVDVVKQFDLLA